MASYWNHRFLIFSFLSTGLGSLLATKQEPEFSFGGRFHTAILALDIGKESGRYLWSGNFL